MITVVIVATLVSLPQFALAMLNSQSTLHQVFPASSSSNSAHPNNQDNVDLSTNKQVNNSIQKNGPFPFGPKYRPNIVHSLDEPKDDALYPDWKNYIGYKGTQKITRTYKNLTKRPQRTVYDRIARKCTYAMALNFLSDDPNRHLKAASELEPRFLDTRGRASNLLNKKKDEVTRIVMDLKGINERQARYVLNRYLDENSAELLMSDDVEKIEDGVRMLTRRKNIPKGRQVENVNPIDTASTSSVATEDIDFQALDRWLKEKEASSSNQHSFDNQRSPQEVQASSSIAKKTQPRRRRQTKKVKETRQRLDVYGFLTGLSESRCYSDLRNRTTKEDLEDLISKDPKREIRAAENILKAKRIAFGNKIRNSVDESLERIKAIKKELAGRNCSVLQLDSM